MAIEPVPHGDWRKHALKALNRTSLSVALDRKSPIAWKLRRQMGSVLYADGVEVRSIWLGPSRHALCVTGKRFYFGSSSGDEVDHRPERTIVGSTRPKAVPVDTQIRLHWAALEALARGSGLSARNQVVQAKSVLANAPSARKIIISDDSYTPPRFSEYTLQGARVRHRPIRNGDHRLPC